MILVLSSFINPPTLAGRTYKHGDNFSVSEFGTLVEDI